MSANTAPPALRIRWRIFGFLFGFGLVAYFQQKSITIAAERIMPELHLTQLQISFLSQAFVVGYALFQIPGGFLGQKLGARHAFTLISLVAFFAMISTALAPFAFGGERLFLMMLLAQFLLGIAQGGIFPMSAGVFESWFPPRHWALVQGLQSMGLQLGAAMTPPLIASLMKSGVPVASAACTKARGASSRRVMTTHERPSEKNPRAASPRCSCVSVSRYDSSVSPTTCTRVGRSPGVRTSTDRPKRSSSCGRSSPSSGLPLPISTKRAG